VRLVIPIPPMQKPSIRSKRWKDWRRWADALFALSQSQGWISGAYEPKWMKVEAFFGIPKGLSEPEYNARRGAVHRQKPDANHVWNAVADALYPRDERIPGCWCLKRWDDGSGPRLEIVLE
jgi:hypothetical protein